MDEENAITETKPKKGAIARGFRRVKELQKPSNFAVIFHNDDFTSKEFVVCALMTFFHKNEIDAISIMSEVHTKGKAAAGIYDYQISETKIHETRSAAQDQEYPLKLPGEQVE